VCISTGSSCADDHKASPMLVAIDLPQDHGMARLSFGLDTTLDEVTAATRVLADVVLELAAKN
jgi:cysteine sulfinate desulfinase/cysteine desulfurase-like protein